MKEYYFDMIGGVGEGGGREQVNIFRTFMLLLAFYVKLS